MESLPVVLISASKTTEEAIVFSHNHLFVFFQALRKWKQVSRLREDFNESFSVLIMQWVRIFFWPVKQKLMLARQLTWIIFTLV